MRNSTYVALLCACALLGACGEVAPSGDAEPLDAETPLLDAELPMLGLDAGPPRVDAESSAPMLYQSVASFEPEELGRMELLPAHRRGPTALSPDQLSVLPLTVWAPMDAVGSLPVVIWSHGGGSRTEPGESGRAWARAFARAGYAVVAMHHMARSGPDVRQNVCAPLGVVAADCGSASYIPYYESTDRPQDAVAVLDALAEIGARFGVQLDAARVAVAGHSGGTNTSIYLAGGERNALPPTSAEERLYMLPDPRPLAFIAMSPPGGVPSGWTAGSLSSIGRPVLSATGAGDLDPERRSTLHDGLGAGDKYRLYFNSLEADHGVFGLATSSMGLGPFFEEHLVSAATAFLDAHVLGDSDAEVWLESAQLGQLVDAEIEPDPTLPSWAVR